RPVDQRTLRGALAAVPDRNRPADDREAVTAGLRREEVLRGSVAEIFGRGDTLGVRRTHERKVFRQDGELGARLGRSREQPLGLRQVRRHVAHARHLNRRRFHSLPRFVAIAQGAWLAAPGGSSAQAAPSCGSSSRATSGACQLPVTQYAARPMPLSGSLKMRVKISNAAATPGPPISPPTVGSILPGSAVTTACCR